MPRPRNIYETLGRQPVHPFPARMAPDVVLKIIRRSKRQMRVLDPTMGSGTVLAFASRANHRSIGIDIDPLAVLIARVWVTPINQDSARRSARQVLKKAEALVRQTNARDAYPNYADRATKQFIQYWFDPRARRELFGLATTIAKLRSAPIRDALWCAFSRLIIAKQKGASLALDLAHSRPHKFFKQAPALPLDRFLTAVEHVLANCAVNATPRKLVPKTLLGDARDLPLKKNSIDLVVTSPPYLNAIDYLRCSKFSLVWMGQAVEGLKGVRSRSIGTEVGRAMDDDPLIQEIVAKFRLRRLNSRQLGMVKAYADDMRKALEEVARVLKPGARAVYVIGENSVRGVFIRNAAILTLLAKSVGLNLQHRSRRILPQNMRYLPPPSRLSHPTMNSRMRAEVVLHFVKTK